MAKAKQRQPKAPKPQRKNKPRTSCNAIKAAPDRGGLFAAQVVLWTALPGAGMLRRNMTGAHP